MLLRLTRALAALFSLLVLIGFAGVAAFVLVVLHFGRDLPDYRQLTDYEPPTVTRIHAGDGRLLAEYAHEKRVFVPIEAIPKRILQAFLAAEDQNFYSHGGIDIVGIARAALQNVQRLRDDRRPTGASTITQQVAKNFLLTNEVSIERKIKEAILSFRIEKAYTKDHILELYLNQIYLGMSAYGVASAALEYFDKSLDELTIAEMAFLAGLPKAPSTYHPIRNADAAVARRDWVVGRMLDEGFIDAAEAEAARAEPLVVRDRAPTDFVQAEFFTEEVRRLLVEKYGEDGFYQGGLSVHTTVDPRLQAIADEALRHGLVAYDQRKQGWRGPIAKLEPVDGEGAWQEALAKVDPGFELGGWQLAVVLEAGGKGARIGLPGGEEGFIPLGEMTWAREELGDGQFGPEVTTAERVVAPFDVVAVERVENGDGSVHHTLRQAPRIDGALVALDPHTGRVLALSGGFSFQRSWFNRATQARRQPGSAFKPFVYLAGLEAGLAPNTILLDAPLVVDQGPGLGKWKPSNYSNQFYGPSTMRLGLEKSRNLMTARLAQEIGIERVLDVAERFGIDEGLGPFLSAALGSNEVTLLELTAAYASFVNGGKQVTPSLVERIQDRHGLTIDRRDARPCEGCEAAAFSGGPAPEIPDDREQIVDAPRAYQIVSLMEGVVQRGTGVRAKVIGKPLAGKTGTTNESRDAWFMGFTPDLVCGVYVGFDTPETLGKRETGSSVALPIFIEFMQQALEDEPPTPFRVPPGVRLVRVDARTGQLPGPGTEAVIMEAFLPGNEPTSSAPVPAVSAVSATEAGDEGIEGIPPPVVVRPAGNVGGLY